MKKIGFKYEIIASELESMIENGEFSTGKLPAESALMDRYKVGKITVYKAMSLLVDKGLLVRVKGSGTFIKGCEPGNKSERLTSRNVLVIMHTTGHVFSKLFDALRRELSNAGLVTLSIDLDLVTCDARQKNHLTAILNSGIYGVILFGDAYWKNPVMRDYPEIPTVFVGHYDYEGIPLNGAGVFFGYEAGAYLATKHLLELGRRRIVFFRHPWRHTFEISESHRLNHPIHQMEIGYKKALAEYGIERHRISSVSAGIDGFDLQLRGLLAAGSDRPDGVICMADYMASHIIAAAEEMDVSIPGDLAVVGYFDTPWSRESRIPITSVSVGFEETAKIAVVKLLNSNALSTPELIPPKLLVRESTSGIKQAKFEVVENFLQNVI